MKKLLSILSLAVLLCTRVAAQDEQQPRWERKLGEQAEQLEAVQEVVELQTEAAEKIGSNLFTVVQQVDELAGAQTAANSRIDSLQSLIAKGFETYKYIQENKDAIRQPVQSQEDANALFAILFGVLNMVLNGIALAYAPFRAWVDKYLSKSMLALATGLVFTAVAVLASKGEVTVVKALTYLPIILGTHFGGFTLFRKKQKGEPKS